MVPAREAAFGHAGHFLSFSGFSSWYSGLNSPKEAGLKPGTHMDLPLCRVFLKKAPSRRAVTRTDSIAVEGAPA